MAETLGEQGPRLTLAGPEAWLLETIVGALGDGITVQEASGRLVYANDHAAETLGFADASELLAASQEEIRRGSSSSTTSAGRSGSRSCPVGERSRRA